MTNYDLMKYNLTDLRPEEVIEYLRKSQSDDPLLTVEEVLERHEGILKEWVSKNIGGEVPEANIYREVVSGETIVDRPEINKVLKRIEAPTVRAILIVEPQRLTRGDLEDIGRLMKLIKYTNTLIITPDRVYNLHFQDDWDAFERELKRGNDYLEYTKKILSRGKVRSVSEGNYIGSIPPYGYDRTTIINGNKKCQTLVENKEQADVVRMIFDMYVNENMGMNSISHRLNDLNITTARNKKWTAASIKDILANQHYIGKIVWNFRKTVVVVEDSEIKKTRPKQNIGEYLVFEGKHDAIIPEELFWRAQAKSGKNPRVKSRAKIRNPLASLVYCSCGKAMMYRTYKSNGVERSAPRLLCNNQRYCNTASALYSEVFEKVRETLAECIEDFEIRIDNNQEDSVKLHQNLIKQLEAKAKELNEKEIKLWNEKAMNRGTDEEMPEHVFKTLKDKLKAEQEEVQQALYKAYESMPEPVDYEDKLMKFKDALAAMDNPDAPAALVNNLLKSCINRITYTSQKSTRITKANCKDYGIEPVNIGKGMAWDRPKFELDIDLKL